MASSAGMPDDEERAPLAQGFAVQRTIIVALMMHDMNSRYARSRFGMLTAVIEPVVLLASMFLLRYFIQGTSVVAGIPLVLFLTSGYLTDLCFRIVAAGVMASCERKLPSQMFPQVTSFDLVVARGISSSVIACGAMLIAFTLGALIEQTPPGDMLLCWIAAMLDYALAVALGLVLGMVVRQFPSMRVFMAMILRINFAFSGVLFSGRELPTQFVPYVSWSPTFHIVELMREGWFSSYISPFANPIYVVVWIVVLLAIGMPLERLTGRVQQN